MHAQLRLLQLTSPSLPIGAFAYSQGLEQAIEQKWVTDSKTLMHWIEGQLKESWLYSELPIYFHSYRAFSINTAHPKEQTQTAWQTLCAHWYASRESSELRAEAKHTDQALRTLLKQLTPELAPPECDNTPCPPALFAAACKYWKIQATDGAQGFCWSWVENQIIAATKLMALGQTECQTHLSTLIPTIESVCIDAKEITLEQIGQSLPAVAIASANHEEQYCRLFRS